MYVLYIRASIDQLHLRSFDQGTHESPCRMGCQVVRPKCGYMINTDGWMVNACSWYPPPLYFKRYLAEHLHVVRHVATYKERKKLRFAIYRQRYWRQRFAWYVHSLYSCRRRETFGSLGTYYRKPQDISWSKWDHLLSFCSVFKRCKTSTKLFQGRYI